VHDTAVDAAGRPVIVFATFPSRKDHRYQYARWTGAAWEVHPIVSAGPPIERTGETYYSGGMVLDAEDPSIVYLSRRVGPEYEIERWQTPDGGRSWAVQPITSGSRVHQLRPVTPRGLAGAEQVLWMRGDYPGFRTYRTAIWTSLIPPLTGATG
jgi:hypothetical protein